MLQVSRSYPYSTAKWVLFPSPSERASAAQDVRMSRRPGMAESDQRSALRRGREPPVRARAANIRQDERAQRAGLHFRGRRVRLAPERASSAGHRAQCARRSDRGVFLLVAFLCAAQDVRMSRAQGRGGRRQRSSGPLPRRAGVPRKARPGLSSAAGLRSDESAGATTSKEKLPAVGQPPTSSF